MLNFQKRKLEKYKKEIEWLLREKYNFSEIEISDFFSYRPRSTVHGPKLNMDLDRIFDGEPIDYIIGFKNFLGCKIDLSLKPLIPRPETEYWVKEVFPQLLTVNSKLLTILDLCCGSGCIGISILKHIPNCSVTFADISEDALEQTRINLQVTRNKLQETNNLQFTNYKLIRSDLFKNLKGRKFDYIFCNPPYVPPQEIKGNLLHEPKLALDGKKDGIEIIYKILKEFPNHLNPGGKLFLEFGYGQKAKIEKFLTAHCLPLTAHFEFHKDQYNKYRLLVVGL